MSMDAIRQKCKELGIKILLIQEPYMPKEANILNFGEGRSYIAEGNGNIGSAIVIMDEKISVMLNKKESDGDCVSVEVQIEGKTMTVVSLYCRPKVDIRESMNKLEVIVRKRRGRRVMCGADLNARSVLWNSASTDRRGNIVEGTLEALEMEIINIKSNVKTFEDTRGRQSNIDALMITSSLKREIGNGKMDIELYSDHRMLIMEWTINSARNGGNTDNDIRVIGRYNMAKTEWKIFNKEMQDLGRLLVYNTDDDLENMVERLQDGIEKVCEESMPRIKMGEKQVGWWTKEIAEKRQTMRRKMKRWLRTKDDNSRRMFVRARTEYFSEIRNEKRKWWTRVLEEEGEKEPWGKAYKILRNKNKKETRIVSLKRDDGSLTESMKETVGIMMQKLIPKDEKEKDTERQKELRVKIDKESEGANMERVLDMTIDKAIKRMKTRKAPGQDGLKSEIVKAARGSLNSALAKIVNKMLQEGRFPSLWKKGVIKVFLKSEDKDATNPKSYRPVTLLPVLGKMVERVLVDELERDLRNREVLSKDQYGYRKGVGTIDALMEMGKRIKATKEKYLMGIFMDISGAFDGAWWPKIMDKLREFDAPRNITNVIRDYFRNRKVTLKMENIEEEKILERGCPQGSVLGPLLWTIIYDGFLKLETGEGTSKIGYADDGLILVEGKSRKEIERRCERAMEVVGDWMEDNKLELSKEKTVLMLLKGRMNDERQARVYMKGVKLKCVQKVKYLGIWIERGLKYNSHVKYLAEKILKITYMIKRVTKASGGMSEAQKMVIYKSVIEPIMMYGCELWGEDIEKKGMRRIIKSMQRKALLGVIGGYSTISHEAVRVIAGIIPMDLHIRERVQVWKDVEEGKDKEKSKEERREETMEEWQKRWSETEKGRETYKYMPDVRERKKQDFRVSHYVTQYLSGHGNFNAKLKQFNLVERGDCPICEEEETSWHVLKRCKIYEEERKPLEEILTSKAMEFERENLLRDEEVRKVFWEVVKKIGKKKEGT
ncbi:hypothetical protein M0802_012917 [Mischocyttarus mexicanus]|nr:hypothetical protein M0802_012917 [Mischocyttarus mexicanus]